MTALLAFFVLICILVFVHEYGHFWAARRCGVQVLRFSIGFGKVLWRKTDKHGTEFAFSLIPLGGYVQMYNGDEAQANEKGLRAEQALTHKSVGQRAFIVLAGPVANFLFAIVAYWAVFSLGIPSLKPVVGSVLPQTIAAQAGVLPEFQIKQVAGRAVQDWEEATLALIGNVGERDVAISGHLMDEDFPRTFQLDLSQWDVDGNKQNPLIALGIRPKSATVEPIIADVVEQSPAEKAGIKVNDKILSVNQQPFDWAYLLQEVQKGEPLAMQVMRADQVHSLHIVPEKTQEGHYRIGIVPQYQPLADKYRSELKYDMLTALQKALAKVGSLIVTICQFIGNLVSGDLSLKNMGGPISMAKGAGATAEIGLIYYLSFMALISVNLGVMNLFPLLPLDGGQLLLLGVEAIRGKALSENIQLRFQQLGMVCVLALMGFALFNDLIHF